MRLLVVLSVLFGLLTSSCMAQKDFYFEASGEDDDGVTSEFPTDDEDREEEGSGMGAGDHQSISTLWEASAPTSVHSVSSDNDLTTLYDDVGRYDEEAERTTKADSSVFLNNSISSVVPAFGVTAIPRSVTSGTFTVGHGVSTKPSPIDNDVTTLSGSSASVAFTSEDYVESDIGFNFGGGVEVDVIGEPEVNGGPIVQPDGKNKNTELDVRKVENEGENEAETEAGARNDPASALAGSTHFVAAVVVGGCIGLLFAVCVIMLLVYRMRKKDEGSYALEYGLDGKKVQGSYEYTKGVDSKEYFA